MEAMAIQIIEHANSMIDQPEHYFRVKNTKTFNEESQHKEQRGSATFHAVSRVGISGFGVETSRDISDESLRVEYQVMVINAFLDAFGIESDHPRFALETPVLNYLAVSVNGEASVIVEEGGTLAVPPGASVEITHVEANYERGLVVDVEGAGSFNDFHRPIVLHNDTRVYVRKDKYPCGGILFRIDAAASVSSSRTLPAAMVLTPKVEAFRLAVNGEWTYVLPGATLRVLWGDELRLDDPLATATEGYKINFRGFVGNTTLNDGEDRGYPINTAHDLLQRFSLSPEEELYEVRAVRGQEILARAVIHVVQPRLQYILIRRGIGPLFALAAGDTLRVLDTDRITVVDVVTEPGDAEPLTINFRGFPGPDGPNDRGYEIEPGRDLLPGFSLHGEGRFYEITARRKGLFIGRITVAIDSGAGYQW